MNSLKVNTMSKGKYKSNAHTTWHRQQIDEVGWMGTNWKQKKKKNQYD